MTNYLFSGPKFCQIYILSFVFYYNLSFCSTFSFPSFYFQNVAQVNELQELHRKYVDDVAKEKHSLVMKMQEIEQEFKISLKKEQQQHNVDIEILTEEKVCELFPFIYEILFIVDFSFRRADLLHFRSTVAKFLYLCFLFNKSFSSLLHH